MDELDLLAMDLRDEFDQIPQELFALRHLWLRVMLDVEMARINEDAASFVPLPHAIAPTLIVPANNPRIGRRRLQLHYPV